MAQPEKLKIERKKYALNGANIYLMLCTMMGLVYTDFCFGDLENFRFWEDF